MEILDQLDVALDRISAGVNDPAAVRGDIHAAGGADWWTKIHFPRLLVFRHRIIPDEASGRGGPVKNTNMRFCFARYLSQDLLDSCQKSRNVDDSTVPN